MISNGLYRFCLLCVLALNTLLVQAREKHTDTVPSLPSVQFKEKQVKLSRSLKATLDSVVQIVQPRSQHKIALITGTSCNPKNGARSWHRAQAVANYLVKKGINPERMICQYSNSSDVTLVELKIYDGEMPFTAPTPHPNVRRRTNQGLSRPNVDINQSP